MRNDQRASIIGDWRRESRQMLRWMLSMLSPRVLPLEFSKHFAQAPGDGFAGKHGFGPLGANPLKVGRETQQERLTGRLVTKHQEVLPFDFAWNRSWRPTKALVFQ